MLDSVFSALTSSSTTAAEMELGSVLICSAVSILLGLVVAFVYMYRNVYGKSFVVTLALLPVIVQAVIMLVNGNLGTGVAVLGAFSLVRFRSIPGSAREIGSIFFAMAIGLATGMGYLTFAVIFTVLVGVLTLLFSCTRFGDQRHAEKLLKITIPENLDYSGIFDDLFARYTLKSEMIKVKTTNMGSLYELHYHILLRDIKQEKQLIDDLRCRNGNLDITCGKVPLSREEL